MAFGARRSRGGACSRDIEERCSSAFLGGEIGPWVLGRPRVCWHGQRTRGTTFVVRFCRARDLDRAGHEHVGSARSGNGGVRGRFGRLPEAPRADEGRAVQRSPGPPSPRAVDEGRRCSWRGCFRLRLVPPCRSRGRRLERGPGATASSADGSHGRDVERAAGRLMTTERGGTSENGVLREPARRPAGHRHGRSRPHLRALRHSGGRRPDLCPFRVTS